MARQIQYVRNNTDTRCGFVAVIGAPNAGKSTLVNTLVGEKVSIVTHKIQTTRFNVRGIAMIDNAQLVLVDTPGIFEPKTRIDRSMVHAAWSGVSGADAIVHVVDAATYPGDNLRNIRARRDTNCIVKQLSQGQKKTPVFLTLNKIDLIRKDTLLELVNTFNKSYNYKEIFMISAENGSGVCVLASTLVKIVPAGPFLFPEDQAADIGARLQAAEITREKLFLRLHNELPYASHVETENWQVQKNGTIRIEQVIYVRRPAQKPIVLGKKGQTIKWIGQSARRELKQALGAEVHLFLFVKVRENWSENRSHYTDSGLEFDV